MSRSLYRAHPLVCFVWLCFVLGITIFSRSPVLLGESAVFSAVCAIRSGRGSALPAAAALMFVFALSNPLFSHNGATSLFFIGDLPITLEALAYGAVFGCMLFAAVLWGSFSTAFMTSDKYIWLFGRVLPAAGLTLSCALRFVPLFVKRTAQFRAARRDGSLRGFLKAFGASLSFSAEEAISAADSMRSRGYGSGRRSFYSLYRFSVSDGLTLAVVVVSGTCCALLCAFGAGRFFFYPALGTIPLAAKDAALYANFALLCLIGAVGARE